MEAAAEAEKAKMDTSPTPPSLPPSLPPLDASRSGQDE